MVRYKFDEIAINSTEKKKPVEEDKYTYLGLDHLDSGTLKVSRFGADVAPIGEKLIMRKGDVLFGKRRAYQKKVAIAPFDGIFSAHGMVLRPRTDVIKPKLFPFFVSSNHFLDEAIKISVGSLSPTINWRDLKDLEFNIPPIEKQDVLADQLWAMEETKEAYNQLLIATDALVKSQFIEMFGDEVTEINGWRTVPVSDIIYKPLSGEWGQEDVDGTGISVLRTTNFTDIGEISYEDVVSRKIKDNKIEQKALRSGDILIEKSGGSDTKPVGRVVFYKGTVEQYLFNNFTALLRVNNPELIDGRYLFQFLYNSYCTGGTKLYDNKTTGIHNLKLLDYLSNTYIPLPPLALQKQFINFLESTDKSKFALLQNIEKLEQCRNALMQKSFG